ncbi:probable pre-mRNA-splicing factor ATP-dependent RNA helicase DEAH9 [Quercus robur]|uniref:probable pre-mRNA-splicing factor ATP-dependent RNA helicase DEAH9 n=1 Tax=Quercus robur TaxID=38942 RepID=UPI0021624DB6|nr:probable pre-mRNA-splicing factor ATP-dependent RNA helicase DEAH9 [Quercus robur]
MEPAILSVEGRGFNVQIHFAEVPVSDYVQAVVSTVLSIHNQEPMGDILVFLTGQDDIDTAVKLLNEEAQSNGKKSSGLIVLPLYSGLSCAEQELIFTPTPRGKRKVVISTNIAETSLTLEVTSLPSRGTTFNISLLTCVESRIIVTVLKFKVSNPFLQSSSSGISHCHSTHLKVNKVKC